MRTLGDLGTVAPQAPRAGATSAAASTNGGFEARLWQTADAVRNNMDAAEYNHVVLVRIFLKYMTESAGSTPTRPMTLTIH